MSKKSSNVPSNLINYLIYSAIGTESLRIARVSNNPDSFSTSIKPLVKCTSRQRVSIGKIDSVDFLTNAKEILMFVKLNRKCYI